MRIFFPLVLVLWLAFIFMVKSTPIRSLRGGEEERNLAGKEFTIIDQASSIKPITMAANHAIIVAGHAVMRLNRMVEADRSDGAWYLLPYQEDQSFPEIIKSHVQKGIEIAGLDPSSLLIFSGGQTRKDVGPTSEGASYYYLAEQMKWISNNMKNRIFVEEYARDSYENLLFSICRFKELSGSYPSRITVVGFDFKSNRFNILHRNAIGFPANNFSYAGLRPESSKFNHLRAEAGEKLAVAAFTKDMYACSTESLNDKRRERDPFHRTIPYRMACPEIESLLTWLVLFCTFYPLSPF